MGPAIEFTGTNLKPAPGTLWAMGEDSKGGDWYLKDWMAWFGKRQADLAKSLGWTKNRAHFVWHGTQPYRRPEVNEIARWLGIKPYELLMPPNEAMALRRLRETAATIVAENDQTPFEQAPPHEPTSPSRRRTG